MGRCLEVLVLVQWSATLNRTKSYWDSLNIGDTDGIVVPILFLLVLVWVILHLVFSRSQHFLHGVGHRGQLMHSLLCHHLPDTQMGSISFSHNFCAYTDDSSRIVFESFSKRIRTSSNEQPHFMYGDEWRRIDRISTEAWFLQFLMNGRSMSRDLWKKTPSRVEIFEIHPRAKCWKSSIEVGKTSIPKCLVLVT